MEEILEKRFEAESAGDAVFNLGKLLCGEFFPARADRSIIAEAAEEDVPLPRPRPASADAPRLTSAGSRL